MVQATGIIKKYELVIGSVTLLSLPISYTAFKLGYPPQTALYVLITTYSLAHFLRLWVVHGLIKMSIRKYIKEVAEFIDLLHRVYADFGFQQVLVKLSTRPEKRVGSNAVWDKAEAALQLALDSKGLAFELQPGEGAFYGPKIEFSLKDCLNRVWQCGTIQVDFSMPERLGAVYVAESGAKQAPVMLHRAILGSMERFIGILIEHYAGYFPLWLAPIQAVVVNITDRQAEFAQHIAKELSLKGLRVKTDLRNEKIGFKIREHSMHRVPYLLIVGDKEVEAQAVTLRTQNGTDLGSFTLAEVEQKLVDEITRRAANA